ncbi:MAG: hypothetical protein JXR37_06325 [Kiritimatiellae bacterium]|nr:hypothetical protein [Kiritimatiellia bacterium]
MRIGLPRCLLYFALGPFWRAFFRALGCEILVSTPMTPRRFCGTPKRHQGDICLPIECAFLHAEALREQVDWIFVPRLNRLHRDIYVCPACAGLPDLLRNVLEIPNVLSFNLTPFAAMDGWDRARLKPLGFGRSKMRHAVEVARGAYARFVAATRSTPSVGEAVDAFGQVQGAGRVAGNRGGSRILLLGMPYVLGDAFINKGVPALLQGLGCGLSTPSMLAPEGLGKEYRLEGYLMYWTLGGMSIAALLRAIREKAVDGVVYCSSFACGVDSCIVPIVQSICRRVYDLPCLVLVLDEHAENTHINVRVEAFLDGLASLPRKGIGRQ